MFHQILLWGGFNLLILLLLALDLGVFNRKAHEIKIKEALNWTAFWIALSLGFNLLIYWWRGADPALEFLTGYLVEKSLSMDNIFVFLLIFTYFKVPAVYQHKILFWGIIGALIMRAFFIFAGITLIQRLHWVIYVFGAFLIFAGLKLAFEKKTEIHPERNIILRLFRRFVPVSKRFHGDRFFIKKRGIRFATPLFLVLVVVETTDVLFAVDSIPAVLSITQDAFIVYTSNVFAILGLRSLYFALAEILRLFRHLHYGLSFILVFVGVKMLLADIYTIPVWVALSVIAGTLALSVLLSIVLPSGTKRRE